MIVILLTFVRGLKNIAQKLYYFCCVRASYIPIYLLFVSNVLLAQDSTYYLSAHKKSDDSLKYELNQIIKNHTEFTYTSSSTDVWEIDPVFDASVAKGITAIDTAYWNSKLDSSSIQNFVDLTTAQTVAGAKTFSSDLTVNGITVGKGGGAIASNTANGYQALRHNTTGNGNTATGVSALYYNTTGNDNTANGDYALRHNTTSWLIR